jgi:tetratricopeptide (TPR) repeat protein
MTPATTAVSEILDRVLKSQAFSRSERARDLLRHLVEREQAGEAERLKGFSIGVDVFGRDAEFDPTTDAVVRVQAGRLRELLTQYYADEGADDVLRISIPRGGYVPVYEWHGRVPEPKAVVSAEQPPTAPRPPAAGHSPATASGEWPAGLRSQLRLLWASLAAMAAMLILLAIDRSVGVLSLDAISKVAEFSAGSETAGSASSLPTVSIQALPDQGAAAELAAAMHSALAGFETINLIEGESNIGNPHFDFHLAPAPRSQGVYLRIEDRHTGMVLLSRLLDAEAISAPNLHRTLSEVLSSVVAPSGLLYAYMEQHGLQGGAANCLLLRERFLQEAIKSKHGAAYRCYEKLVAGPEQPAIVYAGLAMLQMLGVLDGYDMPPTVSIQSARALVLRAIHRDPTSSAAHSAYGYLQSRLNNPGEELRWMRKAYQLNSYDLGMAANYGHALVSVGEFEEAERIMISAVDGASAHPAWWDYTLFISAFMCDHFDVAFRASEALTAPGRPHYLAARLIAAHSTNREDLAAALRGQFVADYPELAADPRRIFAERHRSPKVLDKLVAALAAAGVGASG